MAGVATQREAYRSLFDATRTGNLVVVRDLATRVDINRGNRDGCTVLMVAAHCGHIQLVRFLHECGAQLEARDRFEWTALVHAARNGQLPVLKRLISLGADCTIRDVNGCSPLILAADNGHWSVVSYLASIGVDIDAQSRMGDTALCLASAKGHIDTVTTLIAAGCALETRGRRGRTALMQAAAGGHLKVVELLVYAGARIDCVDDGGRTVCWFEKERRGEMANDIKLNAYKSSDPGITIAGAIQRGMDMLHREMRSLLVAIRPDLIMPHRATTNEGRVPRQWKKESSHDHQRTGRGWDDETKGHKKFRDSRNDFYNGEGGNRSTYAVNKKGEEVHFNSEDGVEGSDDTYRVSKIDENEDATMLEDGGEEVEEDGNEDDGEYADEYVEGEGEELERQNRKPDGERLSDEGSSWGRSYGPRREGRQGIR